MRGTILLHLLCAVYASNYTCGEIQSLYESSSCCNADPTSQSVVKSPRVCAPVVPYPPLTVGCDLNCHEQAQIERGTAFDPLDDYSTYVSSHDDTNRGILNPAPTVCDADDPNWSALIYQTQTCASLTPYIDGYTSCDLWAGAWSVDATTLNTVKANCQTMCCTNVAPPPTTFYTLMSPANSQILDTHVTIGSVGDGDVLQMWVYFKMENAPTSPGDCTLNSASEVNNRIDAYDIGQIAITYDDGTTWQLLEDANTPYNSQCANAFYRNNLAVEVNERSGWSGDKGWFLFNVTLATTASNARLRLSTLTDRETLGNGLAFGEIKVGGTIVYGPSLNQYTVLSRDRQFVVQPLTAKEFVLSFHRQYYPQVHFNPNLMLPNSERYPTLCTSEDFLTSYPTIELLDRSLIQEHYTAQVLHRLMDPFRRPLGGNAGCAIYSYSNPPPNYPVVDDGLPGIRVFGAFTTTMCSEETRYCVRLVTDVIEGSTAAEMGLQPGDMRVGCGGRFITIEDIPAGQSTPPFCNTDDGVYTNWTMGSVDSNGNPTATSFLLVPRWSSTSNKLPSTAFFDYKVVQSPDGNKAAYVKFRISYSLSPSSPSFTQPYDTQIFTYFAAMFDFFRANNVTDHLIIDQRATGGGYADDAAFRMGMFVPAAAGQYPHNLEPWRYSYNPISYDSSSLLGINAFAVTDVLALASYYGVPLSPITWSKISILNNRDDCSQPEYFTLALQRLDLNGTEIVTLGEPTSGCMHMSRPGGMINQGPRINQTHYMYCHSDIFMHDHNSADVRTGGLVPDVHLPTGNVMDLSGAFTPYGSPGDILMQMAIDEAPSAPSPPPPPSTPAGCVDDDAGVAATFGAGWTCANVAAANYCAYIPSGIVCCGCAGSGRRLTQAHSSEFVPLYPTSRATD